MNTISNSQVTVPPGRYYLGDPCYVVPDEQWMPLLESSDFFRQPVGTLPGGHNVVAFQTAYGDGCYAVESPDGFGEVDVDAGIIGLVPMAAIDEAVAKENGLIVKFREETSCENIGDGILYFGHYQIDTKGD